MDKIKPSVFTWTDDQPGVIAQEVGLAYPETVSMAYSTVVPTSGVTVGGIIDTSTWNTTYAVNSGSSSVYNYTTAPSTVSINTDGLTMAVGTDIKVGGKSLFKAIEQIEERLGILNPNPELEERWDKLKDLRKQYMEMEKDILEKEKIMKILKEK